MESRNTPVIPLPNEGEGGAVFPGDAGATPVVPLPNPGEGGPVNPGTPSGSSGGTVIIQPLPGFIPIPQQLTNVRFLNAACGYPALSLYVGSAPAAGPLEAGSVSSFVRFPAGRQVVTVTDSSGYIYLQNRLSFEAGERSTIIVLLREGGLELQMIQED